MDRKMLNIYKNNNIHNTDYQLYTHYIFRIFGAGYYGVYAAEIPYFAGIIRHFQRNPLGCAGFLKVA